MKPSKTAYATKKKPAKRADGGNPMIDKLLKLKYRINDAAAVEGGWSSGDMSSDKDFVIGLINNIRNGNNLPCPSKIQLEECNKIWRKYE